MVRADYANPIGFSLFQLKMFSYPLASRSAQCAEMCFASFFFSGFIISIAHSKKKERKNSIKQAILIMGIILIQVKARTQKTFERSFFAVFLRFCSLKQRMDRGTAGACRSTGHFVRDSHILRLPFLLQLKVDCIKKK